MPVTTTHAPTQAPPRASDTPGRLQRDLAIVIGLAILTGLLFGIGAHRADAGTNTLGNNRLPLLIDSQRIYTALADADATAGDAFLSGGLEPLQDSTRYENDLDLAGATITAAARLVGGNSPEAKPLTTLSVLLHQYDELVGTARANNRQGFPVGAAYLAQASDLNRDQLQPAAQRLFSLAQSGAGSGYGKARSTALLVLAVLAGLALLLALVLLQRFVSQRTRRTVNPGLLAATLAAVILLIWGAALGSHSHRHLSTARTDGSGPIATLSGAQIAALTLRDDESLTLVARGSGAADEADYQTTYNKLQDGPHSLLNVAAASVSQEQSTTLDGVSDAVTAFNTTHSMVRALDDGGSYPDAVTLALSAMDRKQFAQITTPIGQLVQADQKTFTTEIDSAGSGLGSFTVIGPILALVVCALSYLGLRPRIEEYR